MNSGIDAGCVLRSPSTIQSVPPSLPQRKCPLSPDFVTGAPAAASWSSSRLATASRSRRELRSRPETATVRPPEPDLAPRWGSRGCLLDRPSALVWVFPFRGRKASSSWPAMPKLNVQSMRWDLASSGSALQICNGARCCACSRYFFFDDTDMRRRQKPSVPSIMTEDAQQHQLTNC